MNRRASIRKRLRFAILLCTTVAVALSCAVFVLMRWRSSLREHEQRLLALAGVLAENCASPLAFLSPDDATKVLGALHSEPAVKTALLFDAAGNSFATYRAADRSMPLPAGPRESGIQRAADRLLMFHPVVESGRRYGTLFIGWDLHPWYAEMRSYTIGALAVLAACVLAAMFVGRLLERSLTTPIFALANTADEIARQKNYAVRAEVPAARELAMLANAFNTMLSETEQLHAQLAKEIESSRRTEQHLRLITDATPGLISYIDPDERYRFANREYQRWFKRQPEEIIGRTMTEILGESAMAGLRPQFQRALAGEAIDFEVEAPYREGGVRWIHAHYIPHRAENGQVLGVVVLVLDMTERKRMEASLAKAHAELEQHSHRLETTVQERTARMREVIGELEAFSYSIAHDMRAPLRSMQGFSRLLMEEHSEQLNDEGKSFLRRIVASADRLDRLIQDVLNYSRVVREELRMEKVDTQRLIEDIVATYPNLQKPHADIRVDGSVPAVWANPAALTQVISNLLGNAVKFVKPGTTPVVRVTAERFAGPNGVTGPTEWVRLNVADNGIGIPRDAQHRLFAMFQRLHRPELYEGTGMGLAIVRKAVERMGGRLGVESEEGRGSRFWVELKAEEPP